MTAPDCTCVPCTTPGRGHPGIEHCAACCAGSLIEEYDHACPEAEHRAMAALQFPPAQVQPGRDLTAQDVKDAAVKWFEDPSDLHLYRFEYIAAHLNGMARPTGSSS